MLKCIITHQNLIDRPGYADIHLLYLIVKCTDVMIQIMSHDVQETKPFTDRQNFYGLTQYRPPKWPCPVAIFFQL